MNASRLSGYTPNTSLFPQCAHSLPPPLVNIHDITVASVYRGRGLATRMLAHVEHLARTRGACKLTLEVLEGNRSAARLYAASGFEVYPLDPAMGRANFLQKGLD